MFPFTSNVSVGLVVLMPMLPIIYFIDFVSITVSSAALKLWQDTMLQGSGEKFQDS